MGLIKGIFSVIKSIGNGLETAAQMTSLELENLSAMREIETNKSLAKSANKLGCHKDDQDDFVSLRNHRIRRFMAAQQAAEILEEELDVLDKLFSDEKKQRIKHLTEELKNKQAQNQ